MANQAYIEKYLAEPLQKMMVATLNQMPAEPSQHMQDYISLHYFFEKERKQSAISSQAGDEELRSNLRQ